MTGLVQHAADCISKCQFGEDEGEAILQTSCGISRTGPFQEERERPEGTTVGREMEMNLMQRMFQEDVKWTLNHAEDMREEEHPEFGRSWTQNSCRGRARSV